MTKIFFHSYKGGCGRSYIMANVAVALANNPNTRVGIVDLDYDAPGTAYFMCKAYNKPIISNDIDLIYLMINNSPAHLNDAIIDVSANISLLPINSRQPRDRMDDFVTLSLDRDGLFNDRLEIMLNNFGRLHQIDYMLIDLRPGTGFLVYTLAKLFDKAVQIFKINAQDILGTKMLNMVLSAKGPNVNVLIPTLVPMTIDDYEVKLRDIINAEIHGASNKPDEEYFTPVIDALFFDDRLLKDNPSIDRSSLQYLQINKTIKYISRRIKNG